VLPAQGSTELGEILTVGDDRELIQCFTAAALDLVFQLHAMLDHVLARGDGGISRRHGARSASASQTQQSQHARESATHALFMAQFYSWSIGMLDPFCELDYEGGP